MGRSFLARLIVRAVARAFRVGAERPTFSRVRAASGGQEPEARGEAQVMGIARGSRTGGVAPSSGTKSRKATKQGASRAQVAPRERVGRSEPGPALSHVLERARLSLPYAAPEIVVERCLAFMLEAAEAGAIDASPNRKPPSCPESLGTMTADLRYALEQADRCLGNVGNRAFARWYRTPDYGRGPSPAAPFDDLQTRVRQMLLTLDAGGLE